MTGDQASTDVAAPVPADVTVRYDAETFMLLLCGRVAVDSAVSGGLLEIEGDSRKAAEFGRWFHRA